MACCTTYCSSSCLKEGRLEAQQEPWRYLPTSTACFGKRPARAITKKTVIPLHKYPSRQGPTRASVQLRMCLPVQLCSCPVVKLYNYIIVQLRICVNNQISINVNNYQCYYLSKQFSVRTDVYQH
jgi:hypothetical protein